MVLYYIECVGMRVCSAVLCQAVVQAEVFCSNVCAANINRRLRDMLLERRSGGEIDRMQAKAMRRQVVVVNRQ